MEEPGRSNIDPIQNQLIQQGGAGCGTENRLIFCCVYAKAQGLQKTLAITFTRSSSLPGFETATIFGLLKVVGCSPLVRLFKAS